MHLRQVDVTVSANASRINYNTISALSEENYFINFTFLTLYKPWINLNLNYLILHFFKLSFSLQALNDFNQKPFLCCQQA